MLLVSYNVDSSLPKIIQPRMSMVARLRNCFRKKEPSRVSQSPIESGRIWGLGLDTLLLIQRSLWDEDTEKGFREGMGLEPPLKGNV